MRLRGFHHLFCDHFLVSISLDGSVIFSVPGCRLTLYSSLVYDLQGIFCFSSARRYKGNLP